MIKLKLITPLNFVHKNYEWFDLIVLACRDTSNQEDSFLNKNKELAQQFILCRVILIY